MMQFLQINDALADELAQVRECFHHALTSDVPVAADLMEYLGRFRGKMIRPALVLLTGKACGGVSPTHHVIAAVVEMIHLASLVHDDVLDEADLRRNAPTINALHGNEAAVLLGDLLMSHAFHLCSSLDTLLACRLLSSATNTVCEGELLQLHYRGRYDITEQHYFEIIERKTASLFAASCYLGAAAAGAEPSTCAALERYGLKLGTAFQIADDVTDLTGDRAAAGKTLRTDLMKEKVTLPVIHYLAGAPARDGAVACAALAHADESACEDFVEQLHHTGSVAYARRHIARLVTQARDALPDTITPDIRDLLIELADSVAAE